MMDEFKSKEGDDKKGFWQNVANIFKGEDPKIDEVKQKIKKYECSTACIKGDKILEIKYAYRFKNIQYDYIRSN